MVSVSATTSSSYVVNLLRVISWDASCLAFDFSGENLSTAHQRRRRQQLLRHVLLENAIFEIVLICFTYGGTVGGRLKIVTWTEKKFEA
jgi:hypothetical protein